MLAVKEAPENGTETNEQFHPPVPVAQTVGAVKATVALYAS